MSIGVDLPIWTGPREHVGPVLPYIAGRSIPGGYSLMEPDNHGVIDGMLRRLGLARFTRAEITVHPWPIRLGDEIQLHFFRGHRRRVAIERIEAFIECAEGYLEVSGDHFRWCWQERTTIILKGVSVPPQGKPLRFDWSAVIPKTQPASLSLKDSAIRWRLCVRLVFPKLNMLEAWFPLLVLPEIRE